MYYVYTIILTWLILFLTVAVLKSEKLRVLYWSNSIFVLCLAFSDLLFSLVDLPLIARHYSLLSNCETLIDPNEVTTLDEYDSIMMNMKKSELTICNLFSFLIYSHIAVSLCKVIDFLHKLD